jgi:hypothetical protein
MFKLEKRERDFLASLMVIGSAPSRDITYSALSRAMKARFGHMAPMTEVMALRRELGLPVFLSIQAGNS